MTKRIVFPSLLLSAGALLLAGCYYYDAQGRLVQAPVHVSGGVAVGTPPLVIREDPDEVWLIRQSGVYFLPGISADVFFFDGRWYYRAGASWFWGNTFRGPWTGIGLDDVPSRVRRLPPDYRNAYQYRRVPYGQWKQRGYKWDDDDDRDDDHDRGRRRWKDHD